MCAEYFANAALYMLSQILEYALIEIPWATDWSFIDGIYHPLFGLYTVDC
jgi:hypothetical protein